MGAKTFSIGVLLVAVAAAPTVAQDDAGWAPRKSRGALPPADPDEGLEIALPRVDVPPMPPIPLVAPAPDRAAAPGVAAIPGVVPSQPAAPGPNDPPVVQVLNQSWSGWSGGFGLMILKPYVSNNPAYTLATPRPGVPAGFVAQTASFSYDPQPAIQLWLAFDDPSGWGGRLRLFCLEAESDILGLGLGGAFPLVTAPAVGPAVPGAPVFGGPSPVLAAGLGRDFVAFQSDLKIVATDLEGTYGYMGNDCSIQGSLGLRCLYLRQGYHATLANPGDGTTAFAQVLRVEREFRGCGPTASVFARQRIGCSPVALYAGLRGSIVYGTMEETYRLGQVGAATTVAGATSRSDLTIPVTEVEFGAEYGAMAGPVGFFVRAGVVSQTYWDAGGATGALGNLSLIGGQIAIGVAY
jgi:hypothetical protein